MNNLWILFLSLLDWSCCVDTICLRVRLFCSKFRWRLPGLPQSAGGRGTPCAGSWSSSGDDHWWWWKRKMVMISSSGSSASTPPLSSWLSSRLTGQLRHEIEMFLKSQIKTKSRSPKVSSSLFANAHSIASWEWQTSSSFMSVLSQPRYLIYIHIFPFVHNIKVTSWEQLYEKIRTDC